MVSREGRPAKGRVDESEKERAGETKGGQERGTGREQFPLAGRGNITEKNREARSHFRKHNPVTRYLAK